MNPFKYGIIVSGDDFCPRPELKKKLSSFISSGQNVLLEGERRVGKTSLIYETVKSLKNIRFLYVDLLEIKTIDDLCRRIIKSLISLENKSGFVEKLYKSLSHFRPSMSIDPLTGSPSLSLEPSIKFKPESIEELVELIKKESQKNKLVVVFDEFQDILNLKEAPETLAVLRSKIQFHSDIPYVFSGSIRSQMNQIFNYPDSAFYKSAITLTVGPLKNDIFTNFIKNKFLIGKRKISNNLIIKLLDIAQHIPGDIQQLCGAVWEVTEEKEIDNKSIITAALKLIFSRELKGYEAYMKQISGQQLRCLIGLAKTDGTSLYSSDFIKISGIKQPSSIKKAIDRLEKINIVFFSEERYKFLNPFFKSWLLYKNY